MQARRQTAIERVLDARDQFVAMCLALCPPPTISSHRPGLLTNDLVTRSIGERWVLSPVRRFIVWSASHPPHHVVVSVSHTLGIVGTNSADAWWTDYNTVICQLGRDRILTYYNDPSDLSLSQLQVVDLSNSRGGSVEVSPIQDHMPGRVWGNHKWVVEWNPRTMSIHRIQSAAATADVASSSPSAANLQAKTLLPNPQPCWVVVNVPRELGIQAAVVFSHNEPAGLVGFGDEVSVLVQCGESGMRVLTVDLDKSFSSSSMVVVRKSPVRIVPKGVSSWIPHLFMDHQSGGEAKVVCLGCGQSLSAFAVSLRTGKQIKLCDGCVQTSKANDHLVRIGLVNGAVHAIKFYNVFTGTEIPTENCQTLLDRGLILKLVQQGTSGSLVGVIDEQTSVTLCLCPPGSSFY
ncbi:hypothetical protein Pelo_4151 [Pelomyxa schiedti]|nr:hypothetical protein Pelo_4151 [Pelomyxa schiedti]